MNRNSLNSNTMSPEVLPVNATQPDTEALQRAATAILAGRLVAFPTETVYGLGANALDPRAVERIFAAKGRPTNNPIIVHVADVAAAAQLTTIWPDTAQELAQRFWPGPLTLVLPKRPEVPAVVTGGGPNVGVRLPAHPVAAALLRTVRVPIAAPSANASLHISPTTAEHVVRSLGNRVDLVLDAGACPGGLESTVVDLASDPPRLLRPGLVSLEQLRQCLPEIVVAESALGEAKHGANTLSSIPLPAPGQLARHYAPRVPLELVAGDAWPTVERYLQQGERVGWLTMVSDAACANPRLRAIEMPGDAAGYAARLYAVLHGLDDGSVDRIVVSRPPDGAAWQAIHDRLRRAATSAS